MYVDGGARGNPGPAAAGYVVYDESMREVHRDGSFLGITTNNFAEYTAVIVALEYCRRRCPNCRVELYSDSELVVRQMSGRYRVRSESLKPLFTRACALVRKLGANVSHIRREENKAADSIVNQTLDLNT